MAGSWSSVLMTLKRLPNNSSAFLRNRSRYSGSVKRSLNCPFDRFHEDAVLPPHPVCGFVCSSAH